MKVAPLFFFYKQGGTIVVLLSELPAVTFEQNSWSLATDEKKIRLGNILKVNLTVASRNKANLEMMLQLSPVLLHVFSRKTSCFPVKKQVHWEPGSSAAVQVTVKMRGDWRFSVAWSKMSHSMNSVILIQWTCSVFFYLTDNILDCLTVMLH